MRRNSALLSQRSYILDPKLAGCMSVYSRPGREDIALEHPRRRAVAVSPSIGALAACPASDRPQGHWTPANMLPKVDTIGSMV